MPRRKATEKVDNENLSKRQRDRQKKLAEMNCEELKEFHERENQLNRKYRRKNPHKVKQFNKKRRERHKQVYSKIFFYNDLSERRVLPGTYYFQSTVDYFTVNITKNAEGIEQITLGEQMCRYAAYLKRKRRGRLGVKSNCPFEKLDPQQIKLLQVADVPYDGKSSQAISVTPLIQEEISSDSAEEKSSPLATEKELPIVPSQDGQPEEMQPAEVQTQEMQPEEMQPEEMQTQEVQNLSISDNENMQLENPLIDDYWQALSLPLKDDEPEKIELTSSIFNSKFLLFTHPKENEDNNNNLMINAGLFARKQQS